MSKYKTNIEMAEIFKALSNPHRLEIFQRLCRCCEPGTVCRLDSAASICVGDLGKALDIAPSTISHHIKELVRAGLLKTKREGKQIQCWVDPAVLEGLANYFAINIRTNTNTKTEKK